MKTTISFRFPGCGGAAARRDRLPAMALTAAVLSSLGSSGCSNPEPIPLPDQALHREQVESWHADRVERLQEPQGWLSVIGLTWLEEGANPFGSAQGNFVRFPGENVPPRAGTFFLRGDVVQMEVEPGIEISDDDGNPVSSLILSSDASGRPTRAWLGSLVWHVIERQDLIGIRLRDTLAAPRLSFQGVERFPVRQNWLIPARFDRHLIPRTISVPNVLGNITEQPSPGAVVFKVGEEELRLDVTGDPEDESFFVIFGDRTNGEETYSAGRFLYVSAPDEKGRLLVDFNKAYNPPCVFTDYATCPLPPEQNVLPVRIEAGEKNWGH